MSSKIRLLASIASACVLAACGNRSDDFAATPTHGADTITVQAHATSASIIVVQWTASSGAGIVQYRVARNGTARTTISTAAYTDTGLTAATSYSYTIVGLDATGSTVATSLAVSATTFALSVATVSIAPAAPSVFIGQTVPLHATTKDSSGHTLDGLPITWTSASPNIATVSSTGLVTAVAAGAATINATSEGQTGQAVVTVSATPVSTVAVAPSSSTVSIGQTLAFAAVTRAVNGDTLKGRTVTWSATDTSVAAISPSGAAVGRRAGSTTVVATSEGKTGQATLTVTAVPVSMVVVTPPTGTVAVDANVTLTAVTKDSVGNVLTGRQVAWSTADSTLATVSAGLVIGKLAGTVQVVATSEGKTGSATITVTPAVIASLTLQPSTLSVAVGAVTPIVATLRDALNNLITGRTITWSSNATGVATVSASGVVTGVSAGTATITASSGGHGATATVTVTNVPVVTVVITPATVVPAVGQTVQLTATPRDGSGNALTGRVVTWSSSDTTVATISTGGLLTAVKQGTTTITANVEGVLATLPATVHLVGVGSVAVQPNPLSLDIGLSAQVTAVVKDSAGNVLTGRPVTWTTDASLLASVSSSGVVSALAAGLAHISATSGGVSGMTSVTVTVPTVTTDSFFVCAADSIATTVTKTIGALGGTIAFGHHKLFIPPAGVLVPTSITATEPADGHVDAQLSPDGLQLLLPATLTLGYGQCSETPNGTPEIAYLSGPLGQILQFLNSTVDAVTHTVAAPINHFSVYIMAERK